jgi:hypothetical protein
LKGRCLTRTAGTRELFLDLLASPPDPECHRLQRLLYVEDPAIGNETPARPAAQRLVRIVGADDGQPDRLMSLDVVDAFVVDAEPDHMHDPEVGRLGEDRAA